MNNAKTPIVDSINQRRAALREHIAWLCNVVETKIEHDHISDQLKKQVQTMIQKIAADFDELMQLRRQDDFYDSIVEKSPPAQHTVDQLCIDYDQLATELPQISDQLTHEDHALKTRKRLHRWLVRLNLLDHREYDLLQKVWNTDIGAAD